MKKLLLTLTILLSSFTISQQGLAETAKPEPPKFPNVRVYVFTKDTKQDTEYFFAQDCFSIRGSCKDSCGPDEVHVRTFSMDKDVSDKYIKEFNLPAKKLSPLNYCGVVTLAQREELTRFGYTLDVEKIQNSQKCCVPKAIVNDRYLY